MHDKNGKPLAKGDTVLITCVIKSCSPNPEYCNVTLETVEPMYPTNNPATIVLNAKQVEKFAPEIAR